MNQAAQPTPAALRILIAGETWITHAIHVKGFASYSAGSYAEGLEPLVEAFNGFGHDVTHISNHLATADFPSTRDALASYDLIILSDIAADTLQLHPATLEGGQRTPDRLRLIGDFVSAGGGLLMIGGYMSFSGFEGKARFQGTPLAQVLPVSMLGFDDRVEEPDGVVPLLSAEHPVLDGLASGWPFFLGYNRIVAKANADVLLRANSDDFLVVGEHGRGRTAAFASDCSPHWGSPEFIAWSSYSRFWNQLAQWLSANNDRGKE